MLVKSGTFLGIYFLFINTNVDMNLCSLKDGSLNTEMLQFKSKFPREVLLCRVMLFYSFILFTCLIVFFAKIWRNAKNFLAGNF